MFAVCTRGRQAFQAGAFVPIRCLYPGAPRCSSGGFRAVPPTVARRWQDQKNKPPGASSAFKFADLLNSAKSKAAGANERRKKRRQRKGLQEQAADNLGAVNAMR